MHTDRWECYEQWTTGTLCEIKLPISEVRRFYWWRYRDRAPEQRNQKHQVRDPANGNQ